MTLTLGLPTIQGHSHNDYEQPRPLWDALEAGVTDVEVDIFRVGDQLLVGHSRNRLAPARTLEALYLEPLRGRSKESRSDDDPSRAEPVTLIIDLKTAGDFTWERLREVLGKYPGTRVLLTGNRVSHPETLDRARQEGTPEDLDGPLTSEEMPQISARWSADLDLAELAARAHARGVRLRVWGGPDDEAAWRAQREAGVDRINSDRPAALMQFLRGAVGSPSR